MDKETSQMFTQLLAALLRTQVLRDVEIKQLLTDAVARVETDTERKPILDIRARIFMNEKSPF